MGFRDHFSANSPGYARHRPRYPEDLFAWLAGLAPSRGLALDVATGSGQAAGGLAAHVATVIACDASATQLAAAEPHPRVRYLVASAEALPLADGSADIVTVAQALHWFDLERFYAEARRVLRPSGVVAAWTYNLLTISPDVDRLVRTLYTDHLGPWWPPERRHVENGYADLPFPFTRMASPAFDMHAQWTCDHLLGYLRTWSSWQACTKAGHADPVAALAPELRRAFGHGERDVAWPLTLLAGHTSP